jgi:hypothetical protein
MENLRVAGWMARRPVPAGMTATAISKRLPFEVKGLTVEGVNVTGISRASPMLI